MRDEPGETSLQEISLWPVCYFYFLFFGKGREGKEKFFLPILMERRTFLYNPFPSLQI